MAKKDKNLQIYQSLSLKNCPENFQAGKTREFKENWFKITHDKWIRSTIQGYKVEIEDLPKQIHIPNPIKFTPEEQLKINSEIDRFLKCKIIEKVNTTENNEYISNIFFRPKKDGKVRIILNLKNFNQFFLEKIHFKMETLQSAIAAMRKDFFWLSRFVRSFLLSSY